MTKNQIWFDKLTQIMLPVLTISGQFMLASKMPREGFIVINMSTFFWMYTAYQSFKKAGQVGILITTIIMAIINLYGFISWWFIK